MTNKKKKITPNLGEENLFFVLCMRAFVSNTNKAQNGKKNTIACRISTYTHTQQKMLFLGH